MRIRITFLSRIVWPLALFAIFCQVSWAQLTVTGPFPPPVAVQNTPYSFSLTVTGVPPTGPPATFTLTKGPLPAGVTLNASGTISGTPTVSGTFPISVEVQDSQGQTAFYNNQSIIVVPPLTLTTAACPAPSGLVGAPYSFTISVTGGLAPYYWSFNDPPVPPGLSLDSTTGVVSGTPTVAGTFSIDVAVFDSLENYVAYNCQITISSFAITAPCPALAGVIGSPYTFPISVAGSPAYTSSLTWSIAGGALPPGLSLNTNNGVISGIPVATGAFPISITATLPGEVPESHTYTCNIVINPPPVQMTSGCPASPAPQGSALSYTLTATGGTGVYTWSIQPGLPAGLTLNGNVISGIPTGPVGTVNFTIQVTSGVSAASIPCSLTVSAPRLLLTSACPGNGTVGVAYGPFVLTATGGLGASKYTFAVQGNLPPGVSFSSTSNTISGTPTTAGSYLFSFTVTDGQQTAVSLGCPVTIAPSALQVTTSCPTAAFSVGSPISISFAVAGGQPPYSYNLSGASWLTVNASGATGTISGTPGPSNAGVIPISLTVTDSAQSTAVFRCSLMVNPAPLKIGGSCPASPVSSGSPISVPVTASGGVPPYSWLLAGNSGLSLAAAQGTTNSVTGNAPSTLGAYSFTLTLSDSANSTPATLSCTLNVQLPPLQIKGTCPASALNLPLQLSIPLSATGGQAPYAWKLTAPSWISLSSTIGAMTTVANNSAPDAAGPFSLSVTLTDSANSTPAVFSCSSSINAPAAPAVTVTGLTLQPSLVESTSAGLQLASPALLPVTGVVTLTFLPNAFGITDNPQVYFDGGSRTASFTIAPGQTSFALPDVQEGTDAGTIQLEVTDLQQGGVEVLETPYPSADLVIPREAPVIGNTDVSFANETTNGFDVVINGYSTPRDVASVTLTFTAAAGASLSGTTSFTVNVSSLFSTYYGTAASQLAGSQWQNLYVPVATTGDKSAIGSVAVMLTNSAGNSQTITLPR